MLRNELCKDNVLCCDDNCQRCANLIYDKYIEQKAEIEKLQFQLRFANSTIDSDTKIHQGLREDIVEKKAEIENLKKEFLFLDIECERLEKEVEEKDVEIERLEKSNRNWRRKCQRLRASLRMQKAEIEKLQRFKYYFDDLYGMGLEIAEWHHNGMLEPFDNFYDGAVKEMVGDNK